MEPGIITKEGSSSLQARKSEDIQGTPEPQVTVLNNLEGDIFLHTNKDDGKASRVAEKQMKITKWKEKIINFTRRIDEMYYIPKTHAKKQKAK